MDCSYHQEFSKQFTHSGWNTGWAKCCDNMGCFYFHPNVNPEFMDKPENAAYIKKHRVVSATNLTKSELDTLSQTKGRLQWKKKM